MWRRAGAVCSATRSGGDGRFCRRACGRAQRSHMHRPRVVSPGTRCTHPEPGCAASIPDRHVPTGEQDRSSLCKPGRVSTQNMPAAEVDITVELVRSLLSQQHPDLADLPIAELANGWDNVIFRLGDHFTVRLPRREIAARLVDHEQAVLPTLAQGLPIPIPAPVRAGRPAIRYPWSWSVNPWIRARLLPPHRWTTARSKRSGSADSWRDSTPPLPTMRRSTRIEASSSGTTPRSTSNGPPNSTGRRDGHSLARTRRHRALVVRPDVDSRRSARGEHARRERPYQRRHRLG